ncbi:protein polybromo-1 [Artemisia annua]|uniref:Protein polybromo-1 n=1 Tax=Artemisia annua TaxID=35608 RepID=A0A2U1KPH3_ARTAN|nr:protein polybromo-1 [Artemisia annua]
MLFIGRQVLPGKTQVVVAPDEEMVLRDERTLLSRNASCWNEKACLRTLRTVEVESWSTRLPNPTLGDSVLVRKSPEEGVYVALVCDILHENNDVNVSVKTYYSPEETIGGRRSFHGNKELILTDHLESISAQSVLRKCFVHSVIYYTGLKHVTGPYDYFSRFEYMIGGGDLSPDEVDVYHPACINMTDDEAKQIDSFTCDECRSLDVNQASSSADPDILKTLKQQLEEQARAAEELVKADEERERAAEEQKQAAEQVRAAEERERAAKERQHAAEERQRAALKRIKELEEQSKSLLT